MGRVIVFDFDYTMTNYDSMTKFLFYIGKKRSLFGCKLLLYTIVILLRRLKVISLEKSKNYALRLFLNGYSPGELDNYSKKFASTLTFNGVYEHEFNKVYLHDRRIVCSASLVLYLQYIFTDVELFATDVRSVGSNKYNINYHCYSHNKVSKLKELGINKIDVLFTDSHSDLPLVSISKTTYLVDRNGEIQKYNNDSQTLLNQNKSLRSYFKKLKLYIDMIKSV